MSINTAGKFVGPFFLVLQESKGVFGHIVIETGKNIHTKFVHLMLYIRKEHQTTDEYFDKIRENIGGAASILLEKWSSQIDEGVCIEKFNFSKDPVFHSPGTTKYLQPLKDHFFKY